MEGSCLTCLGRNITEIYLHQHGGLHSEETSNTNDLSIQLLAEGCLEFVMKKMFKSLLCLL